jgi:hypothetical protein
MEHKRSGNNALLKVILGNLFETSFTRIVDIWMMMMMMIIIIIIIPSDTH